MSHNFLIKQLPNLNPNLQPFPLLPANLESSNPPRLQAQPVKNFSNLAALQPSNQPSKPPTLQPSALQPNLQPSSPPTLSPSNLPALQPSSPPTLQPSNPLALNPPALQPSNPPALQPSNPLALQPSRTHLIFLICR